MRLIVGCPIADRAWALPTYFRCLAAQTRRPDGFAFIHSGRVGDPTWRAVQRETARHNFKSVALLHNPTPAHQRHDNARFHTLAGLRNELLRVARDLLGAELFLSLDSDVMLEQPDTIERLEETLAAGYDIAAPLTFLHPAGSHINVSPEICWAFNAGWWTDRHDPQWMARPSPDQVWFQWGDRVRIDIPMAVWLGNRRALECRYRWHSSGEDIGFAQDLAAHGLAAVWDTSLRVRHIWSEQDLEPQQAAA